MSAEMRELDFPRRPARSAPRRLIEGAQPVLVLTRRPHQSIMIGDDIVVTVLEVKGDQIRLGVSAPRVVQVFREEVLVALQAAGEPTAAAAPAIPAPAGEPAVPARRAVPAPPVARSAGSPSAT